MTIALDGEGPLYQQVYRGLRSEIVARGVAPGARLPSTRALAADLGVSRNVAILAYEQLLGEGYAQARTGSGTIVAPTLPDDWGATGVAAESSRASAAHVEPRLARAGTRAVAVARATRGRGTAHDRQPSYDFRA